jgi:Fatty acid hydroxylase superfamily
VNSADCNEYVHYFPVVNHKRIVAFFLGWTLSFCGIALFLNAWPRNLIGTTTTFAVGFGFTIILAAPLEWIVHRGMHINSRLLPTISAIHLRHHGCYSPASEPLTSVAKKTVRVPVFRKTAKCVAHFLFFVMIGSALVAVPAWVVSHNLSLVVGVVSATVSVSLVLITIHDATHHPDRHRLIQGQSWFHHLKSFHHFHHAHPEVNFSCLLPFADKFFGTLYSAPDRQSS